MGSLWTRAAAEAATGGTATGVWSGVTGVSIDTRAIDDGDLFIALRGEARDGHAFVGDAIAAGAGAAMVDHRPANLSDDAPLLIVDDTQTALEALGRAARVRTDARVIAVTGSVGKTSTKEMLRTMLEPQGKTHAAVRSFNNHWGVPLTLARMPPDSAFAVIEIGMNHPGEITPLSRMAAPDVAMITTVAAVHMAAFTSVAEIADAKSEIFAGLSGPAVLNADNPYFDRMCAQAPGRIISFGSASADAVLSDLRLSSRGLAFEAWIDGVAYPVMLATTGRHFAMNTVAALAAVAAIGADVRAAVAAVAAWTPPPGRGDVRHVACPDGALTLLDESYNANPTSTAAALDTLAEYPCKGRRIAILGDMLELGPDAQAFHTDLADLPALADIDAVHCCGPLMADLHGALALDSRGIFAETSASLAEHVPELVRSGDVVMVKGSLGARMSHVIKAIEALARPTARAEGG